MGLTQVQIDSWWYLSCALFCIGAFIINIGFGLMMMGALLGIGSARADMQLEEKENGKT